MFRTLILLTAVVLAFSMGTHTYASETDSIKTSQGEL